MTYRNRQFRLINYPSGPVPTPTDFEMVESDCPTPEDGQILCRTLFISLDPGLRGRMSEGSYANRARLGEVVPGFCLSEVIVSRSDRFGVGDFVVGPLGWQEYALSDGGNVMRRDKPVRHPLTTLLHVLGGAGLTAWVGLNDIARVQTGETVLVSAAMGAVGSAVGQIAKIKGCRVVGIVGSPEKCASAIADFGFDSCLNRRAPEFLTSLREGCEGGVDIYFDNVAGDILSAVLELINLRARIVLCGMIAESGDGAKTGPNLRPFLTKRASLTGFINFDHDHRMPMAMAEIEQWLAEGRLKYREDIVQGLENTPWAFSRMLMGESVGKAMVQVHAQ